MDTQIVVDDTKTPKKIQSPSLTFIINEKLTKIYRISNTVRSVKSVKAITGQNYDNQTIRMVFLLW
jgi:hypothetical protein